MERKLDPKQPVGAQTERLLRAIKTAPTGHS
jgi:hypothetical protein